MSWQPPANDGGAPITGYQLERQSGFSPRWAPVNKDLIEGTTYDLSDLVEDNTYIFRVKAVNKAGPSNPSEPSETYKAKNPWSKLFSLFLSNFEKDLKILRLAVALYREGSKLLSLTEIVSQCSFQH